MRRPDFLLPLLVAACVAFVGCGGEGTGPGPTPPPQTSGQVTGRVTGVADPGDYTITVDGRPVNVRPGANGQFTIPGVPPGAHTIGCVGPGGMQGGYVAVRVRRGQTVNTGPVVPETGGQIAGIVTRWLSDGALEPVPQVEVVATSGLIGLPEPMPTDPVVIGGGAADDEIVISAFTDDGGSYIMRAVPPGAYDVSVIVPGNEPLIQFVWVDAGHTSVADFTLYPAPEQGVGTVRGTVTGEGEGVLEGAEIMVTTGQPWPVPLPDPVLQALAKSHLDAGLTPGNTEPGGPGTVPNVPPWIEVRVFSTLSDQDGRYSLNVPVGTHWIECWLDGWEWEGDDIVIEKGKTITKEFVLGKWDDYPPPPSVPGTDPNRPVWPD